FNYRSRFRAVCAICPFFPKSGPRERMGNESVAPPATSTDNHSECVVSAPLGASYEHQTSCVLRGTARYHERSRGRLPRFRGPNGQGAVEDAKVPVTWGEKDILYKVAIPGLGNSSPIISKGRLFLQSAREDGSERILLCYDAASAKQLWAASVPGRPGKTHKKNALASSTPAADGERIYADFWDGDAISWHAFDYQGKVLWHVPLGSFTSQHGAGHSPVVHAGKLFLNNDQDGYAELMAFDAASGEKVWGVERKAFRTCYSSPFVMESGRGGSESVISSAAAPAGAE